MHITYIHTHYIYIYTSTCMHAYLVTYIPTYPPACMHAYIHTYIHACMHACMHICWFNFDALAQGNAYKPTKEPINYRGPGGDRTHDLQTEATPPAASCPARTLHATEIAPKNATPMTCSWLYWTTDNLSGMHMVLISTPVCVNFELRPGAGDIHICWFNFDALAQGNAYKPTKEPINYRGPGGDRTHDLQTEATPPAASTGKRYSNLKETSCLPLLKAGFEPKVSDTYSPADWMPADKPTELSRIKLKTWTRQPVPMISKHSAHSTSLPVGFRTWLWRYTCLLLLISMLWHRQAIFESKGDKLSSSAEGRIRTQGLRYLFTSRLNACWQTDWAIEDQAKNLNSTARPYDQQAFSPLDLTASWLSHLALAIYMFVVVNFDALAQASDIRI